MERKITQLSKYTLQFKSPTLRILYMKEQFPKQFLLFKIIIIILIISTTYYFIYTLAESPDLSEMQYINLLGIPILLGLWVLVEKQPSTYQFVLPIVNIVMAFFICFRIFYLHNGESHKQMDLDPFVYFFLGETFNSMHNILLINDLFYDLFTISTIRLIYIVLFFMLDLPKANTMFIPTMFLPMIIQSLNYYITVKNSKINFLLSVKDKEWTSIVNYFLPENLALSHYNQKTNQYVLHSQNKQLQKNFQINDTNEWIFFTKKIKLDLKNSFFNTKYREILNIKTLYEYIVKRHVFHMEKQRNSSTLSQLFKADQPVEPDYDLFLFENIKKQIIQKRNNASNITDIEEDQYDEFIGYFFKNESDNEYTNKFLIKVAHFTSINQILLICLQDQTLQVDIKNYEEQQKSNDKYITYTLQHIVDMSEKIAPLSLLGNPVQAISKSADQQLQGDFQIQTIDQKQSYLYNFQAIKVSAQNLLLFLNNMIINKPIFDSILLEEFLSNIVLMFQKEAQLKGFSINFINDLKTCKFITNYREIIFTIMFILLRGALDQENKGRITVRAALMDVESSETSPDELYEDPKDRIKTNLQNLKKIQNKFYEDKEEMEGIELQPQPQQQQQPQFSPSSHDKYFISINNSHDEESKRYFNTDRDLLRSISNKNLNQNNDQCNIQVFHSPKSKSQERELIRIQIKNIGKNVDIEQEIPEKLTQQKTSSGNNCSSSSSGCKKQNILKSQISIKNKHQLEQEKLIWNKIGRDIAQRMSKQIGPNQLKIDRDQYMHINATFDLYVDITQVMCTFNRKMTKHNTATPQLIKKK